MQYYAAPLMNLIGQFERLPGIGRKTAQRLAFHVLAMSEEDTRAFADALLNAKSALHYCSECQNLTDAEKCPICADQSRDHGQICVVEDPRDVAAMEKTREYHGVYHVLHGAISPMDGIGPDDLKIRELMTRITNGEVREVIMATNPNIEGEATAMYLSKLIKPLDLRVTRLAYGIPVGGDLEYADEITLLRAFEGRREME